MRQGLLLATSAACLRRRLLARCCRAVRRIWRDRERSVRRPTAHRGAPAAGAAPALCEGRTAGSRSASLPRYRLICSLPVSEHGTSALRAVFCTFCEQWQGMKEACSQALAAQADCGNVGKCCGQQEAQRSDSQLSHGSAVHKGAQRCAKSAPYSSCPARPGDGFVRARQA